MAELSANQTAGGKVFQGATDTKQPKPKPKDKSIPSAIDSRLNSVEKQNKLLLHMRTTMEQSENARRQWRDRLETWYKQYVGIVEPKNFPWKNCSNLHIPITAIIVDTLISRMLNPLHAVSPFANVSGISEQGKHSVADPKGEGKPVPDSDKARDIELLLQDVLERKIDVYPVMVDWVKEAFLYGRGVIKMLWRKDKRKFNRRLKKEDVEREVQAMQKKVESNAKITKDDLEFLNEMTFVLAEHDWDKQPILTITREEVVYDNPDWEFVPVVDFMFHPTAKSINKAPYVGHRFRMTVDEAWAKQDAGEYTNVDQLEAGAVVSDSDIDNLLNDVQELEEGVHSPDNSQIDDMIAELEFIEWHGRYDIDGDGRMEDVIAVYAPKQDVLLSATESELLHGKKPFAEIKAYPMPGRFESQGVPERIQALQNELNDIHNQRIDNGTITNAAMFKYDPQSDIDPNIHTVTPGMGFPDPTMELLQTGDVKLSSFREEELVRRLIQDLIGVTDFAIGNDSTAINNKTATGIQNVVNEGNQRLELLLRNVRTGVKEAIVQTFQLLQQFGDDEMFYRVVEGANESIKTMSANDIQGMWDIDVSPNSVNTNRTALLQELDTQIQLALSAGPGSVNIQPLLREFYQKMGSKYVEEIMVPAQQAIMQQIQENPEALPELLGQLMQMAQQLGVPVPENGQAPPSIEEQKLKQEMTLRSRELDLKESEINMKRISEAQRMIREAGKDKSSEELAVFMNQLEAIKAKVNAQLEAQRIAVEELRITTDIKTRRDVAASNNELEAMRLKADRDKENSKHNVELGKLAIPALERQAASLRESEEKFSGERKNIAEIDKQITAITDQMADVVDQLTAEKEIVRDAEGKATGVRRKKVTKTPKEDS